MEPFKLALKYYRELSPIDYYSVPMMREFMTSPSMATR